MALAAATVAETLRAEATRARTLDALEAHVPPIPRELALAAAPALVDIAAGTEDRATFDRSALMVARLLDEAPDPSAVHGAAFAGERFAAYKGPRLMTEATQRALVEGGEPLTQADARSYACLCAWENPSVVHGYTPACAAAGRTEMEFLDIVRTSARVVSLTLCVRGQS
jgi:hypothetical protein